MGIKITDVHWAAGFLDGEGSFASCAKTPRIQATQASLFPLEKLQSLFRGAIYPKKLGKLSKKPLFSWVLQGNDSVALMMTLYDLMSPYRTSQIRRAIQIWFDRGAASGEDHYNSVATDEEALIIMRRIKAGESMLSIAREVGFSHTTMSMWMRGKKRPYLLRQLEGDNASEPLPRNSGPGHRLSRYGDEEVLEAMRSIRCGKKTMYRVAKDLELSPVSVLDWMTGKNRPYLLAQLVQEELLEKEVSLDGCTK